MSFKPYFKKISEELSSKKTRDTSNTVRHRYCLMRRETQRAYRKMINIVVFGEKTNALCYPKEGVIFEKDKAAAIA